MRFESIAFAAAAASLSACVVSSGVDEPPPGAKENKLVIDGAEQEIVSIVVHRLPDGEDWAPGRAAQVQVLSATHRIEVDFGSFDAGEYAITPFGVVTLDARAEANLESVGRATSGTLRIVEGDGSVGAPLTIELEDVVVRDECTGAELIVDEVRAQGDMIESDLLAELSGVDPGVAGFVEIEGLDAGASFPADSTHVIGFAAATDNDFNDGTPAFVVEGTDGCLARATRRVFALKIPPTEIVPGETIPFADMDRSFANLFILEPPATRVGFGLMVDGNITVAAASSNEEGSIFDAVITDAVFFFIDDNGDQTDDPPASAERIVVHTVVGLPDL